MMRRDRDTDAVKVTCCLHACAVDFHLGACQPLILGCVHSRFIACSSPFPIRFCYGRSPFPSHERTYFRGCDLLRRTALTTPRCGADRMFPSANEESLTRKRDTYQRVPGAGTQTDAVVADAQAADAVLMALQRADLVSSQRIPDLVMFVQYNDQPKRFCFHLLSSPCIQSHRNLQRAAGRRRKRPPR